MNEMSRDDMLRELELLPIWKLRQPLQQNAKVIEKSAPVIVEEVEAATEMQPVNEVQVIAEPQVNVMAEDSAIATELISSTQPALPLRALPSEDGVYLFLAQPAQALPDPAAELLLQNMLRAMRVNCKAEMHNTADQIFTQHSPKLIICFGVETAEILLQQVHTMAEWRSQQPHHFRDIPLIVTFSPEHLLQHNQDKALAWQDLCLAMQLLQGL